MHYKSQKGNNQSTYKILNLKKDEADERDYKVSNLICPKCGNGLLTDLHQLSCEEKLRVTENIPVDWTPYMSPVKDQGSFGSCVGFAVAAMKEFQEQKEHYEEVLAGKTYKRKQDNYDLSEAWVYWNSKKIDPWPESEGTSIRCAMRVLHKIGIPCEAGWEYDDRFKGEPKSWAKLIAKWGLIDSYWRIEGIEELKVALNQQPVVIGIGCFEEIFNPNNGVVPYPANPDNIYGGHAICAVGYDEDKELVKFKNSWSTAWGDEGYGYLPYSYIRDFMWDGWVAKDLSVTRKILQERAGDDLI